MAGNNKPITGRQIKWGIGLEEVQGYPVKAQALLENRDSGVNHKFNRKFSAVMSGRPSGRRKGSKGAFTFNGSLNVEVTPEGGFPRLLMGRFPLTSSGAGPSYTHEFKNLFGSRTFTLIRQDSKYLVVYPGCTVGNLSLGPDKGNTDVEIATAEIVALDRLMFDLVATPSIIAAFGMDVASADALPPYTSEMGWLTYNGAWTGARALKANFPRGIGMKQLLDKKNGAAGTFEKGGDSDASVVAYYPDKDWIFQDMGVVAPGDGFAPTARMITVPIAILLDPPVNGSGFVNRMTIEFPEADIEGGEEVNGDDEITQSITISPLDNANGDGKITIVNSISGATLAATAAAVPLATIPPSQSQWYWGGEIAPAGGGALLPIIDGGTGDVSQFDLVAGYHADGTVAGLAQGISTMPTTNGFFVGWTVHVIKGVNKGQKATVTGYTAATRRFTTTAGIDALSAGDTVALYK